jgi:hypothetical protein
VPSAWYPFPPIPDQKILTDVPFLGTQKCAFSPLVLLLDSTGTVSIMFTNGASPMSMLGVLPAITAL